MGISGCLFRAPTGKPVLHRQAFTIFQRAVSSLCESCPLLSTRYMPTHLMSLCILWQKLCVCVFLPGHKYPCISKNICVPTRCLLMNRTQSFSGRGACRSGEDRAERWKQTQGALHVVERPRRSALRKQRAEDGGGRAPPSRRVTSEALAFALRSY